MSARKAAGPRAHSREIVHGIFLRYFGPAHIEQCWEALQAAAPHYGFQLEQVEAKAPLIYNLVPVTLQQAAESWLILCRGRGEQEFLVLPCPDAGLLRANDLHGAVAAMLQVIRGGPQQDSWFPDEGYQNLSRSLRQAAPKPGSNRFELLRTNQTVEQLLRLPTVRSLPLEEQALRDTLEKTAKRIQEIRGEALVRVLNTGDEEERKRLLAELDGALLTENLRLYEEARKLARQDVPPLPLVAAYADVLDEETRRFLASSRMVQRFVSESALGDFDFALPGSGLWKAVERELNVSLIWYCRYRRGVVGSDDPWTGLKGPEDESLIATGKRPVNLNEMESKAGRRLKSVMLGSIELMLQAGYDNDLYAELSAVLKVDPHCEQKLEYYVGPFDRRKPREQSLPWRLGQLRELRNRHAHVEPMSQERFQQLADLVLQPESNPGSSVLGGILELKRKLRDHVHQLREKARGAT
jgi:hypothetical protein